MKTISSEKETLVSEIEKKLNELKNVKNEIVEQEDGFLTLLGKQVEIWCTSYIYSGKLVGINATCIKLENPAIVYETGELTDKSYANIQKFSKKYHYIMLSQIESFGEGK